MKATYACGIWASSLFGTEIAVGALQILLQADLGAPAQGVEAGTVHPFAEGAVRFDSIKRDVALVAYGGADRVGEFCDGDVTAKAYVDVAAHRCGVGLVGGVVYVHHENAGGGHVVCIQEFTLGGADTPDGNFSDSALLGFVEPANQCGDDVAVLGVLWSISSGIRTICSSKKRNRFINVSFCRINLCLTH